VPPDTPIPDFDAPRETEAEAVPDLEPFCCWRMFLADAIVVCAGNAAVRKYAILYGLPIVAGSTDDASRGRDQAEVVRAATGRDGEAFLRMCWAKTQKILMRTDVWRAVCAVESALFSGLIWAEPGDPRAGDSVQFTLSGPEAERLIEAAGVKFGCLREDHSCVDGACIRRHGARVAAVA
jgi:hypothetical protein